MQQDFHYCAIRTLAQKAGFSPDEAQVLAYASQYVDDATEHKGIDIVGVPPVAQHLVVTKNAKGQPPRSAFEPTCSAHSGLQYATAFQRDVQRKVYIPFHFLPPEEYSGKGAYEYRVLPNSLLARRLLSEAFGAVQGAGTADLRLQGLVKTGIALHTFADTWAHQRFSGRHSSADNDIERIRILEGGTWQSLSALEQAKLNFMPDIGHVEAMNFPDQSHLTWRYEHDASGIDVLRENPIIFLEACEAIYSALCGLAGTPRNWKSLVDGLKECLSMETDSMKTKFRAWRDRFPDVTYAYDAQAWRADALEGDRFDWDHFMTAEDFATLKFTATGDLKWFLFHVEAKNQREWVAKRIRADLL